MSKIKKFFSKKKEEAAFKLKLGGGLGQGHTLSSQNQEASTSSRKPVTDAYVPPKRKELSDEVRSAAAAALARVENKDSKEFNTSLAAIKAQAKRELEAERKLKEEILSPETTTVENNPNLNLACQGVFFRCPIISEEILSKKEWKVKIKEFLYQQLDAEKALTSCLIMYNCNNKEKVLLNKYIHTYMFFEQKQCAKY